MPKNPIEKRKAALFVTAMLVIIAAIIVLKALSGQSPAADADGSTPTAGGPVARPDTTVGEDVLPPVADSTASAQPGDMGRDSRPADEAGAEDGYWNGYHDGAGGGERDEYDDTSNFPTEAERATYAENYREGYERGFQEGRSGKALRPEEE